MKALFLLGLTAAVISFAGNVSSTPERHENIAVVQEAGRLEVSLASQKRVYRPGDEFKPQVFLRNPTEQDIFVFGNLEWGYSASLMFYIRDAAGKVVEPTLVPDSPPQAPPDDKSEFVKLHPDHFIGTSYFAPLDLMKLTKPGKYSVFVEYKSPFSRKDVPVSPFWARENGPIKSNVVYFEVAR